MAFLTDLITCMTGDSSVNNYATGGIVYEHLPVDFDSTKNWVVFGYTSNGNTDVLGSKNVITDYSLNIQVVSPSIATALDISNRLTNYLINYSSGGIGDITISDDDLNLNTEKNVYYKSLNYNIIYKN